MGHGSPAPAAGEGRPYPLLAAPPRRPQDPPGVRGEVVPHNGNHPIQGPELTHSPFRPSGRPAGPAFANCPVTVQQEATEAGRQTRQGLSRPLPGPFAGNSANAKRRWFAQARGPAEVIA